MEDKGLFVIYNIVSTMSDDDCKKPRQQQLWYWMLLIQFSWRMAVPASERLIIIDLIGLDIPHRCHQYHGMGPNMKLINGFT